MALWNMWWNCCSQIASELIWTFGHTWACLATLWEILGEMLSFSDNLSKYKQSMRSIDSIWRHNWSYSSYNSRKGIFPDMGFAWQNLNGILQKTFDSNTPFITKKVKGKKTPWLTRELKHEINCRDIKNRPRKFSTAKKSSQCTCKKS